jgi:hypothetical protein
MNAALLLIVLLLPGTAWAQQRVIANGCPQPGTEAGCLVLRGHDGKFYDLSMARSRPPLNGRGLRITGVPGERVSYCMQGIALVEVTWEPTATLCPGR